VFDATPANGQHLDPSAACPPLKQDPQIAALVAEKQSKDDAQIAELAASGVKPIRLVYQDGGQHPYFTARVAEVSRPEALVPPTEIVLDDASGAKGKVAARFAAIKTPAAKVAVQQPGGGTDETSVAASAKGAAPEAPPIKLSSLANEPAPVGKSSISGWLGLHKDPAPAPSLAAEPPPASRPAKTENKSTAKTSSEKTGKTFSGSATKDGAKKVTVGPLDKALRAADAQK
jgi:hypothetical protein